MSERELTILQHLAELRRRVIVSVLALLVGSAAAWAFWKQIVQWLERPARDLESSGVALIATEVTETLTTSIKVSLVSGFVVAFPIVLYQIVMFVAPGLTPKERRYLLAFLPGALLCFAAGLAFAYFVLIPPAFRFLLTFGSDVAVPMIKISNFVNLELRLLFWMGLVFETPLVMFLLAKLGIVDARKLSRFRRFWLVIAFILAAIITPTFDPVNQSLVAAPLIALYELGILMVRVGSRNRDSTEAITPAPHSD